MNKKYIITGMVAFLLAATSCNKYLDVAPKGKVILTTVNDYDLFLNGQTLTASGARELNLLADNVDIPAIPQPATVQEDLIYLWTDQYTSDIKIAPVFWGKHYANIYRFNAVINGIDQAVNGTEADKKRIKAEALLGRAFEYLYLVNLYGKVYNSNTAGKDLAVPIISSTDISAATPQRATVQAVYDTIINNIKAAIPGLLPNNATNRFRGSKQAAVSVLARTYLYMGNYTEAAKYATEALNESTSRLFDYNTISDRKNLPPFAIRSYEIYGRYSTSASTREFPTVSFLQSFDTADLRLRYLYDNLGDLQFKTRGVTSFSPSGAVPSYGTSVEEMKLILAECAARQGNTTEALKQLNEIRIFRIRKSSYKALSSQDSGEVLNWVIRERGWELAYRGFRWFDMRRLDAEGRMPAVTRTTANDAAIATLPPHSPKYVIQIPISVLAFNPDMPLNER